uniref:AbrB/MazE/SpoVT family DNA-binding domain-containing protein n=1 Tax=uncultured Thiotrichaceae bacterium TaxID=298394 RepID=A0A6S6UMR6_9GAMM|nr:MAG: AbrB/MazE/SpoVT family DNA-binding domain-containing protein [uncultured Thiotrichaceae bacterium]
MQPANTERTVSLFRNGRNQAIRIPKEYELEGSEATIRREGNRLIIEPVLKPTLLELLASLPPLDESLPDIEDLPLDDVEL